MIDAVGKPMNGFFQRVSARPVLCTLALGLVAGIAQLVWIRGHRTRGGFGVDESSYMATAFELRRAWGGGHPGRLLEAVLDTPRTGPLVPTLSAGFMTVFGSTTTSALMAQVTFYVLVAMCVAGLTARLTSSSAAAMVAGFALLGLPVNVVLARTYQLATAVTAFLCLAVWAMVASDRGERRPVMLCFGAAVGAMLLSRTMAIAYLPGLAIAAGVTFCWSRRVVVNTLMAVGVALVVAAPWWVSQWDSVSGYLVSFGYGRGSTQIDRIPLLLRPPIRLGILMTEIRVPFVLLTVAVVVAVGIMTRRYVHQRATRHVGTTTIALVAGVGLLVLLSSSNLGTYFQVPLVVVAIPLVFGAAVQLGTGLRRAAVIAAVAVSLVNLGAISTWRPGAGTEVGGATMSIVLFGGTEEQQSQDFGPVDQRFASDSAWADRLEAEGEWSEAAIRVAREVEKSRPRSGRMVQTVVGEIRLLNASTLRLTEQLVGRGISPVESPASPEAMLDGNVSLEPRAANGDRRIIVSFRPRRYQAIEGPDPTTMLRVARRQGWRSTALIRLPDGGQAEILVHPDNVGS